MKLVEMVKRRLTGQKNQIIEFEGEPHFIFHKLTIIIKPKIYSEHDILAFVTNTETGGEVVVPIIVNKSYDIFKEELKLNISNLTILSEVEHEGK